MADTEKKKGSIYVDGHEILDVTNYRNRFCDLWFNNYLPRMSYFEGVDMKRVEPELKAVETEIVAVFHNKSIFRADEYQRFCQLGNNGQVIKPKSAGRVLMMSEFMYPFHSNMVDPDTGKPCHVIMNHANYYDRYWTGEDVAIHLQDSHKTFINIHPGCLTLYVSKNSENHHNKATDIINARKLNLKCVGKNTPLIRNV